jgi:histidinol-phosphate aminotransferase
MARSRREFLRSLGMGAAVGAAVHWPLGDISAAAEPSRARKGDGFIRLDSNENVYGPTPKVASTIRSSTGLVNRYPFMKYDELTERIATFHQVKPEQVLFACGSTEILRVAACAFLGAGRQFVQASPTFEALEDYAKSVGSEVVSVPLDQTFAHDLGAMLAHAGPSTGLIYICNPNNPTGTTTPKEDIDWLVANKPAGSIILLDEAYIHLSKAPMASYHVAAGKDVVILRTFSKLYGMAGIRAGAALGRPDLLRKISAFGAGALPITAMVAATASLKSKTVIAERRKIIADIREDTFSFLAKNNIEFLRSDANMFMMNAKRPGTEFSQAFVKQKVYIGRPWPVWPTWVRVSVGTREEMAKFQKVCLECYNA